MGGCLGVFTNQPPAIHSTPESLARPIMALASEEYSPITSSNESSRTRDAKDARDEEHGNDADDERKDGYDGNGYDESQYLQRMCDRIQTQTDQQNTVIQGLLAQLHTLSNTNSQLKFRNDNLRHDNAQGLLEVRSVLSADIDPENEQPKPIYSVSSASSSGSS